jgi:NAD-dependent dihydropyrimidine dehydrogenase PreA subunit
MPTDSLGIILCRCSEHAIIPAETREEVEAGLSESELPYTIVDDLCELSARRDPRLTGLAGPKNLTIVACHPRAVNWLFHAGGAPLDGKAVKVLNMRDAKAEGILDHLAGEAYPDAGEKTAASVERLSDWAPWFPVIDHDLCDDCSKCLDFCLFDVFVKRGEKVIVENPENCKTNCPACARICPEVAIIFPKHEDEPINGAEVSAEHLQLANVAVDVEEAMGSDLYAKLAGRRKNHQVKLLRREEIRRAISERKACSCSCDNPPLVCIEGLDGAEVPPKKPGEQQE